MINITILVRNKIVLVKKAQKKTSNCLSSAKLDNFNKFFSNFNKIKKKNGSSNLKNKWSLYKLFNKDDVKNKCQI